MLKKFHLLTLASSLAGLCVLVAWAKTPAPSTKGSAEGKAKLPAVTEGLVAILLH